MPALYILIGCVALTCTLPIIGVGGLRFLIPAMGRPAHLSTTLPQWNACLAALP